MLLFFTGCDSAISNWIGTRQINSDVVDSPPIPPSSPSTPSNGIQDILATKLASSLPLSAGQYINPSKMLISPDGLTLYTFAMVATYPANYEYRVFLTNSDGSNPRFLNLPNKFYWTCDACLTISPDNQKILLLSSTVPLGPRELFSFNLDGTGFTKISKTLVTGGNVNTIFSILPNSSRVIYAADADIDGVEELYSCTLNGSSHVKLNSTFAAGGVIQAWSISQDQNYVVYHGKLLSGGINELYSVHVDGTGHTKISGAMVAGRDVLSHEISPNSQLVAYVGDLDTDNISEIYIVAIGGGSSTKVNAALIAAGDVFNGNGTHRFSPDSSRIIYTADAATDGIYEVFSVEVNGSNHVRLNQALSGGLDASIYTFSPDGTKVIYATDAALDNSWGLYSINLDGTGRTTVFAGAVVLNAAYQSYLIPISGTNNFAANDTTHILVANPNNDATSELYKVNLDGTGLTQLSSPGAGESLYSFFLTPNRQTIIYQTANAGGLNRKLYRVNVDGTGHQIILGTGSAYLNITDLKLFSALNKILVSYSRKSYLMDFDGSNNTEILAVSPWLFDAGSIQVSPNNQKLLRFAESSVSSDYRIYLSNLDGSSSVQLNPGAGESVRMASMAPDNLTVHALLRDDSTGITDIYRVNYDGTGWAKISGAPTISTYRSSFYSPVGDYFIYVARQDHSFLDEIYAVKNDGTGRVRLNQNLFSNGDVRNWTLSKISTRLVYTAQQTTLGITDLYSVNYDGTSNTKINTASHGAAEAESESFGNSFKILPDDSKIIFIGDQSTNGVYELYSVNWNGTGQTKLNSALVSGGDVKDFDIAASGSKIVFQADLDTDNLHELYSINPVGTGQVKISGTMIAGGGVSAVGSNKKYFSITPDSQYAIFMAKKESTTKTELYAAKLDGSAVQKISGTLVLGGNVADFQFTTLGSRVVYLADADTDGITELYSVKYDGTDLKKLNRSLSASDSIDTNFQIVGSQVIYRLQRNNSWELYRTYTTTGAIERMHPDLTEIQSVANNLVLSPDKSMLIYLLNNENYIRNSIYMVPL